MAIHKVILALGSNRADRHSQLERAIRLCSEFVDIERLSNAIDTEPLGIETNGVFANQMLLATTSLRLDQLNDSLKTVERRLGRNAANRSVIAIDIDIMQHTEARLLFCRRQKPAEHLCRRTRKVKALVWQTQATRPAAIRGKRTNHCHRQRKR